MSWSSILSAGSAARVWTFRSGVRSMGTTHLSSSGSCATICCGMFVIGTMSGAIHVVESRTGLCTITVACAIHTRTVHSIQADHAQGCIVSSAADGTVKIWKPDGEIKATLQNTRTVHCACFLNGGLDVILGAQTQLEIARWQEHSNSDSKQCEFPEAVTVLVVQHV